MVVLFLTDAVNHIFIPHDAQDKMAVIKSAPCGSDGN